MFCCTIGKALFFIDRIWKVCQLSADNWEIYIGWGVNNRRLSSSMTGMPSLAIRRGIQQGRPTWNNSRYFSLKWFFSLSFRDFVSLLRAFDYLKGQTRPSSYELDKVGTGNKHERQSKQAPTWTRLDILAGSKSAGTKLNSVNGWNAWRWPMILEGIHTHSPFGNHCDFVLAKWLGFCTLSHRTRTGDNAILPRAGPHVFAQLGLWCCYIRSYPQSSPA